MQLIPGASQTVNLQNQNEEQEMKDPTREENWKDRNLLSRTKRSHVFAMKR